VVTRWDTHRLRQELRGDKWIWTIEPDGSDAHLLAPGEHPTWSPNGRQIAFTRYAFERYEGGRTEPNARKLVRTEAFVMNADGSARRKLVPGFDGDNHRPAWSPNGRQIAFIGCRCGFGDVDLTLNSLYVVNPNGEALRKLADQVAVRSINFPEWSSDGSKLLVERLISGFPNAFVVSMSGGLRQVATNTGYPDWSPDGRSVAYVTASRDRTSTELHVGSAVGGPFRRLARGQAWDVDW